MDYINYNDFLWGIVTIINLASFLISLSPDPLINLGYKIDKNIVRLNCLSKLAVLTLFLGFWSYFSNTYKLAALALFIMFLLFDTYLSMRIRKEISTLDINKEDLMQKIKAIDNDNLSNAYSLLFKSSFALVIYISFPYEIFMLNIIASIIVLTYELSVISRIKSELITLQSASMKKINIVSIILTLNVAVIIVLSLCQVKLFFNCLLIGLNWAIVSDTIFKKDTSMF